MQATPTTPTSSMIVIAMNDNLLSLSMAEASPPLLYL